jgi:hypothetical protein
MTAADLARLELARRAYKATQPGAAEVQTGVRRARLWLGRPKARRNWFSKGLVLVVLAVGGLAYAKPQALGELVEQVLPAQGAEPSKRAGKLRPSAPPVAAQLTAPKLAEPQLAEPQLAEPKLAEPKLAEPQVTEPQVTEPKLAAPKLAAPQRASAERPVTQDSAGATVGARGTSNAQPVEEANKAPGARRAVSAASSGSSSTNAGVSDWGRVGQALAQGDDAGALSALRQLSDSDDPRTRDKADLGRAQLFMAHGEPEQACALARSLTNRRAGSRIERQAQVLLKSCTR